MKKKSKWLALALAIVLSFSLLPASALAASGQVQATLDYRDIRISVNGEEITPADANGKVVEPFAMDGTVYLPLRAISEALGLDVEWDDAAGAVVIRSAGQLNFVLAEEDDSEEAFVCVVSETGKVYWQAGLDSFDEVFETFGLTDDGTYLKASVVADNDEAYKYLYPEEDWKGLIFADTLPSAAVQASISVAFEQWKDEVYSLFDYEGLRALTPQDWINAAPAEGYQVTAEDIEALRRFVEVEDGLIAYARDSVQYTIAKYCGSAVQSSAVSCTNAVFRETDHIVSSEMQAELGVMARGVTGQNFINCVLGSYFHLDADQWLYCNLKSDGYPYVGADALFENGLYAWRDDGTNDWYLSTTAGEIVYCINDSDIGPGQAFSCLVDANGNVYWERALDSASALEKRFAGEIDTDYVCVHLKPELEEKNAEYLLADGKDPSIYHKYVYFDPNSDWTHLTVDNGGELPSWWTDADAEKVYAAFDEWYAEIYDNIDFDAVRRIFEVPDVIEVTDEDVELLRDWAQQWQEFTDKGESPAAQIKLAAIERFGVSVWNDLVEYVTAYWRTKHTACTGMAISAGYLEWKGLSSSPLKSTVSGSVLDTQTAFTVAYLSDINWGLGDNETNPYLSVATLVSHGLVPSTDGAAWYLTNANTAAVIYEIPIAELLADE